MASFVDKKNRTWTLPELTLWHVKTLNSETGIELEGVISSGSLWDDTDDAWLMVGAMVWHWCKEQHDCTEEDFYRAWDGEVFQSAQEAMLDAIANFTPTKRREGIQAMATTVQRTRQLLPRLTMEKVERIEAILSESVTSGLERLASQIPTDTA